MSSAKSKPAAKPIPSGKGKPLPAGTGKPAPSEKRTPIPKLDAHQLRVLADLASSHRKPLPGGDPYFGVVVDGSLTLRKGDERHPPKGALFEIDTATVEKRPPVKAMIVDCDGKTMDLAEMYDAVFWSEAAVEKFVFPYYASKSLWEAAAVLSKMAYYWYGKVPPDTGPDTSDNGEQFIPFALAHTPDSEWNLLKEGELHLLVRTREGHVKPRSLALLPPPPAGWDPASVTTDHGRQTRAGRGGA